MWPTPDDAATYKLVTYNVQRIDDVSTSAEDPEIPSRFMPCLTSGLAYYIAMKKNPERVGLLKQQYEQDFKLQMRPPRVSLRLTPIGAVINAWTQEGLWANIHANVKE